MAAALLYYGVEATPSSALLISSVTLRGYCLYTQAFGISDSCFNTCVTIYKMEKITPPPRSTHLF